MSRSICLFINFVECWNSIYERAYFTVCLRLRLKTLTWGILCFV